MKEYSSLERVILALNHKEPDKIPFDLGASAVTGININALKNLKKYLGICTPSIIQDEINQIAYCDTSIKNLFKTDVFTRKIYCSRTCNKIFINVFSIFLDIFLS